MFRGARALRATHDAMGAHRASPALNKSPAGLALAGGVAGEGGLGQPVGTSWRHPEANGLPLPYSLPLCGDAGAWLDEGAWRMIWASGRGGDSRGAAKGAPELTAEDALDWAAVPCRSGYDLVWLAHVPVHNQIWDRWWRRRRRRRRRRWWLRLRWWVMVVQCAVHPGKCQRDESESEQPKRHLLESRRSEAPW